MTSPAQVCLAVVPRVRPGSACVGWSLSRRRVSGATALWHAVLPWVGVGVGWSLARLAAL